LRFNQNALRLKGFGALVGERERAFRLAVVVVCSVIALTTAGEIGTLRLGIVAAACLLLPGLGWPWKLRLGDAGDRLAIAIAISICALTVVGTTMAVLGGESTPLGLVSLAAVGAIGFLPRRLLAPLSPRILTLRIATFTKAQEKSVATSDPGAAASAALDGRAADDEASARSLPGATSSS
jgi:hypothetical protein